MSYIQIKIDDGFITRSPTISERARINGHPGYIALSSEERDSVRSILYEDESGIYLTERREFVLTIGNDGDLIFSANQEIEPVIPKGKRYSWHKEWANQFNSNHNRKGLIHRYESSDEAWRLLASRGYEIVIKVGNEYISYTHPCNIFRCTGYGYFKRGDSSKFKVKRHGNEYGLTYNDIEKTIDSGGIRDIRCWNTGSACRWMIHGRTTGSYPIMKFRPMHQGDGAYHLFMGDKALSDMGNWYIIDLIVTVSKGIEFYTRSPVKVVPYVIGMTQSDKYRVGSYLDYDGQLDYSNVRENLPDGITCGDNYWDGYNLSCHGERIPYQKRMGEIQCTDLDSLQNDIHCTRWAIDNAGQDMDKMLLNLCRDGGNPDICNCYLPEDTYYDIILNESGQRVANGVKASSLLQCASGLCSGSGTIGEDIFYAGSRKCDICIQVMTANINADKIEGGVSLRQQCTHVDASYTWDRFIQELISYGAYYQEEGINRHVIINRNKNAIMLVTSTEQARSAIDRTTLLKSMPDEGYIIVGQLEWNKSPSSLSSEILSFMLEAR